MEYINKTIGKYTITRKIGEGGMASVYEAVHEKLGTKVAVKILSPILARNPQLRQRFENEANFMASLDHPNITRVLDIEEQDETLAIVMELLEGEDLDERVKRVGALSSEDVKTIFIHVLNAFEYAHSKGIVHRDIKPANIFIDKNNRVKILDFGIAKLFGTGNEMTQTGTQMGTPVYMSPEQVKGEKSIDHRSDIYALGVTLYFMLTGKAPYESIEQSSYDIFTKIINESIPALANNPTFDAIIQKACQKDRNLRFQQIEDFENALNGVKNVIANTASPKAPENLSVNHTNSKLPQKSTALRFFSFIPLLLLIAFSIAYFVSFVSNFGYRNEYLSLLFSADYDVYSMGKEFCQSWMQVESVLMIVESVIYFLFSNLLWFILQRKFKIKLHFFLHFLKIIFPLGLVVWASLRAMYYLDALTDFSWTIDSYFSDDFVILGEIIIWIPFILFELFFASLILRKSRK